MSDQLDRLVAERAGDTFITHYNAGDSQVIADGCDCIGLPDSIYNPILTGIAHALNACELPRREFDMIFNAALAGFVMGATAATATAQGAAIVNALRGQPTGPTGPTVNGQG